MMKTNNNNVEVRRANQIKLTHYRKQYVLNDRQNIDELYKMARRIVNTSLKTLYRKSPTDDVRRLLNGINDKVYIDDVSNDTADLIQIATESIIEMANDTVLTIDSFIDTTNGLKDEIVVDGELRMPYIMACRKVQRHIHAQKSQKGRKQVSTSKKVEQGECRIYDSNGVLKEVVPSDNSKEVTRGYKLELISLEAHLTQPENYNRLSVSYDYMQSAEYQEAYNALSMLLSPSEKTIFALMNRGYKQTEIAEKMDTTTKYVKVAVQRIRTKIANTGMYDSIDEVRRYKTKAV